MPMPQNFTDSDFRKALKDKLEVANQLGESFAFYQKFFAKLPQKHRWIFNSDISLRTKIEHALDSRLSQRNDFLPVNQIYWSDILESIRAAEHFFYRRSEALINSTMSSLINRDLLSATILARSLLEVCMWHLYHAVIFEKSTKSNLKNVRTHLIDNTELQDMLLKLIWGSKQKDIIAEVKQHSVYKIFDKLTKSLRDSDFDVERSYDFLSEFSHPNVEGNNVFTGFDIKEVVAGFRTSR